MAKQYGLILPGMQKKKTFPNVAPTRQKTRPNIFDEESSDDDDENGPPQLKMRKAETFAQPSAMERRVASKMQEKALAEDATIFQYDEVYDEIENQRDLDIKAKKNEPKKAKYIERLLVVAERRKLENELRVERQVQKERELEGEEFKDKEKFVTTAYRKKLEEMRKLAEREKHEDYLEAIGDVTKQNDLDGFYRHLYEQKLGTQKNAVKPEVEEINYKPIKSDKTQNPRTYRKRRASEGDEDPVNEQVSIGFGKRHLENNIDADSDFSIDSSSSENEDDVDNEKIRKETKANQNDTNAKKPQEIIDNTTSKIGLTDDEKVAINLQAIKNNAKKEEPDLWPQPQAPVEMIDTTVLAPIQEKKIKKDIWKKRTVGEVFDAALQRYYERKAARNG